MTVTFLAHDPCGVCGYRLTPDSAAKVRTYRLRRWPELAEEAA